MRQMEKAGLYINTVRNLKLKQIKGQICRRLPVGKERTHYDMPRDIEQVHIAIKELDTDPVYLSRFDTDGLMDDRLLLLNEEHEITSEWNVPGASHLWNFNLHYLEFLIPLAIRYNETHEDKYKKKCEELIRSWVHGSDAADAWAPYTISLRIPNILIVMEYLGIYDKEIYESIYDQYRYLQRNTETALLANHYFENIRTIVIASVVFKENDIYHKYFDLLLKEIKEQILPDGVHYERSLMYHKIILEDILRVYTVLSGSGHKLDAEKLMPTIKRMSSALSSLEYGLTRTPLFNDAGDNVSRNTAALLKVCENAVGQADISRDFAESGYYRVDNGGISVLFDCGDTGPRYMGGHAHNDCLSFELSVDSIPVFVNSGTGQYQGEMRPFFKSTSAHNTVMIDDCEQSELWGEHRVGRRIHDIRAVRTQDGVIGEYTSYQGDRFSRRLQWQSNTLLIYDEISTKRTGKHIARQFLHLSPGLRYERKAGLIRVFDNERISAIIRVTDISDCLIHREGQITAYAREFGRYEKKEVLEIRTPFEGHIGLDTGIEIYT